MGPAPRFLVPSSIPQRLQVSPVHSLSLPGFPNCSSLQELPRPNRRPSYPFFLVGRMGLTDSPRRRARAQAGGSASRTGGWSAPGDRVVPSQGPARLPVRARGTSPAASVGHSDRVGNTNERTNFPCRARHGSSSTRTNAQYTLSSPLLLISHAFTSPVLYKPRLRPIDNHRPNRIQLRQHKEPPRNPQEAKQKQIKLLVLL